LKIRNENKGTLGAKRYRSHNTSFSVERENKTLQY